jgi:hypothetical protein
VHYSGERVVDPGIKVMVIADGQALAAVITVTAQLIVGKRNMISCTADATASRCIGPCDAG